MRIPVCEPLLIGNEAKYVLDCLQTGWISSAGGYLDRFEQGFADYCDREYGVAATNGTTALHLALASLGVGKGDEVILPTFTIISCALAVLYTGAKPVFVDCDPDTFNIDVTKIEDKITLRTKAIMPVHLYGHPCDMLAIQQIAGIYDLKVVEDAAEAHGSEIAGKKAGGFSDVGCFSFYANKIITTGEGGMLTTNNRNIADRARSLRNLAHSNVRFVHNEIGFNYRMTNIQAALGLAQLENIDLFVDLRRKHAHRYTEALRELPVKTPVEMPGYKNSYWMYTLLLADKATRDGLIRYLAEREIETRTFFIPMHQQPILNCQGEFPVADNISERGLYLPSGTGLTDSQIDRICGTIQDYFGR